MTESGHRRRTTRRGRLSGVPLDQFKAELLGLVCGEVQATSGIEDVQRKGYGTVTVTVTVQDDEMVTTRVVVETTAKEARVLSG